MQILTTRYDLEIHKLLSTALLGPNLQENQNKSLGKRF